MSGRKTKCTPEITSQISEFVKKGAAITVAGQSAGLHETTALKWMHRGEAEFKRIEGNSKLRVRKTERPFYQFFQQITFAKAVGEVRLLGMINDAAEGMKSRTVKTTTRCTPATRVVKGRPVPILDKAGNPVFFVTKEETVLERTNEIWKAAAWLLERRHSDRWALRKLEKQVGKEDTGVALRLAEAIENLSKNEPGFFNAFDDEQSEL